MIREFSLETASPPLLIGRTRELEALQRALEQGHRSVCIAGPPGVGKTSLATAFGTHHAGTTLMCQLHAVREEDELLQALARALRLASSPGKSLEERRRQCHMALTHAPDTLLILDNADHVHEPLTELLQAWSSAVRVLLTTRRPLVGCGYVLELEVLEVEDAMTLFEHHARICHQGFHASPELPALVNALDRLPLAIELVARRARLMSPAQMLAHLERHHSLLTLAEDDARSLQSAISSSWEALPERSRSTFPQWCVLEGSFDLEAVEAIIEVPQGWSGDVLEVLLSHSLLSVDASAPHRFRLLESVRTFLQRHVAQRDALRARHARHYSALATRLHAQTLDPHDHDATWRLEQDRPNMMAAYAWWRSEGAWSDALEVLLHIEPALVIYGDTHEHLRELLSLEPHLEACADTTLHARWLESCAALHIYNGESTFAREMFERLEALDPARVSWTARAHINRAFFHANDEDQESEDATYARALEVLKPHDPQRPIVLIRYANSLINRSLLQDASLRRQADALLSQAAMSLRTGGELPQIARWLQARGWWLMLEGQADRAIEVLTQARSLAQLHERPHDEINASRLLLNAHRRAGDTQRAYDLAQEVLTVTRTRGLTHHLTSALYWCVAMAHQVGDLEEGRAHAIAAYEEAVLQGESRHQEHVIMLLAGMYAERESWEDLEHWSDTLDHLPPSVTARAYVDAYLSLALAARDATADAHELLKGAVAHLATTAFFQQSEPALWKTMKELFETAIEVVRPREQPARPETWRAWEERLEVLRARIGAGPNLFTMLRMLETLMEGARTQAPWKPSLYVASDGSWFDQGERITLSHRPTLQRMLCALLHMDPEEGASVEELARAGWPDEWIEERAAAGRVYTGIRNLRKLGLGAALETRQRKYHWAPEVHLEIADPETQ